MKKKLLVFLAAAVCISAAAGCTSKQADNADQLTKLEEEANKAKAQADAIRQIKENEEALKNSDVYKEAMENASKTVEMTRKLDEDIKEQDQKKYKDSQKAVNDAVLEYEHGRLVIKSYAILDQANTDNKKIVITFDYTNTSDSDRSFSRMSMDMKLYQDGAKLSNSTSSFDKEETTSIKNGATVEVIATYMLRNEDSNVDFEIAEGSGNVLSSYSLSLK